jgi:hypothetical protein
LGLRARASVREAYRVPKLVLEGVRVLPSCTDHLRLVPLPVREERALAVIVFVFVIVIVVEHRAPCGGLKLQAGGGRVGAAWWRRC